MTTRKHFKRNEEEKRWEQVDMLDAWYISDELINSMLSRDGGEEDLRSLFKARSREAKQAFEQAYDDLEDHLIEIINSYYKEKEQNEIPNETN